MSETHVMKTLNSKTLKRILKNSCQYVVDKHSLEVHKPENNLNIEILNYLNKYLDNKI